MNRDMDLLIRTVFGEAGQEPAKGQQAVAAVILNRARQSGMSVEDVALAPGQFEPWGDPKARARMEALTPNSPEYAKIAMTIAPVLGGHDPTGGADHFYSPTAQAALGRAAPSWDNGKGQDIGRHRFFSLGYKGGAGGGARRAEAPSGADIFGFGGDDELAGGDTPSGADIFGLDEVSEPQGGAVAASGPAAVPMGGEDIFAAPEPAAGAASRFRGALTQTGLPKAQDDTYARLAAENKLDPNAAEGSEKLPAALMTTVEKSDLKPGTWYVDLEGNIGQVPSQRDAHAGDSWLKTGLDLALSAAQPVAYSLRPDAGQDARAEAIRQGTASGALLGGKNELLAGIASIPDFFRGGMAEARPAFDRDLAALDRKDAYSREAFPIAHGAGAGAGAIVGGAVMPEVKAAGALGTTLRTLTNAGVGALGGFASTDGGVDERLKGAALGAGLGTALTPLPVLFGRLFGGPAKTELTGEAGLAAEDALKALGTSTAEMSDGARWAMRSLIKEGKDPQDAARLAMAQDLPAPVPLTTGQVTGLPGDQLNFNMALRGVGGPRAAAEAQAFTEAQQEALRLNIARIAGGMADGPPPAWNAGGEAVAGSLNSARDAAKKGVDGAFDAARAAEAPAILPKYDADAMAGGMFDAVADFDPQRIGSVTSELRMMATLARGDVELKQLFNLRSRLSNLRMSADPVEATAAGKVVRKFDDFVGDALSNELFHGDPQTVQLWRSAIGKRRDFGELFEAGDLVNRLTEKTGYGGARRLKVDPGEAGNLIFGRSELGSIGRANLYRDLEKIRGMVDGDTWNALRAEHFVRVARRGEGGIEGGVQQFNGASFLKAWNDAKAKDMRLVQSLYSAEEIATINRFAAVAARVTSPVKGGDNPANTAAAMDFLNKVAGGFGKSLTGLPVLGRTFEVIGDVINSQAAKASMRGTPRSTTGHRTYQTPGRAGGYLSSLLASDREP